MAEDGAYGRVTDPERYRPLHDLAATLVEDLRSSYDVDVEDDIAIDDDWAGRNATRLVRVTPRSGGAPLTIAWTTFPGIWVFAGRWHGTAYPHCGCDACDEQLDDLIRELHDHVTAVTSGRYSEWTNIGVRGSSMVGPSGSSSTEVYGDEYTTAERIDWPAW